MKDSIREKLQTIYERYEELTHLLSSPEVMGNSEVFMKHSKEHSELGEFVEPFSKFLEAEAELEATNELLNDPEMKLMAQEEAKELKDQLDLLEEELSVLMQPRDPKDSASAVLEVRAGTGGDEAALFAGDLFRMYSRYCETKGFKLEVLSVSEAELGGYKEIIARIDGSKVYGHLKFESGAHRVQRVPETESQGRIHTSACTVAVMPEVETDDEVEIHTSDLRIDTFRASGAGGQHVNKTDSAIRITHLPTGVVVECQQERSQHANKDKAMKVLKARLLDAKLSAQAQETSELRKSLVGSGDRSERIRTYNYPQGRITDHRINLTLYKLAQVLDGDLNELITELQKEHQAELLASSEEL